MSADGTTIQGVSATPTAGIVYPDEVATAIRFGQFVSPTGIFSYQCDTMEVAFGNKVEMITDITNYNGLAYAVIAGDTGGGSLLHRLGASLSDCLRFDQSDHDLLIGTDDDGTNAVA